MSLKESREGDLPRGGKDLILARGMCSDAMSPQWGPMLRLQPRGSQDVPKKCPEPCKYVMQSGSRIRACGSSKGS
jgi:hypothetical protein